MDLLVWTAWTGAAATAFIDLWALARRRLFDLPLPDYAPVGRWIGHMRHGRFRHDAIARSTPIAHEAVLGWIAHYLIGIAFAALIPTLWGAGWYQAPTPGPALALGIGTVLAPFLLMQPAMGAGIAASRAPRPGRARFHSLVNHAMFGLGLYLAARVAHSLSGLM